MAEGDKEPQATQPVGSSADALAAAAPNVQAAQKEAAKAEAAASKAEEKEQADREKAADKASKEAGGDLTASLTDPATGRVVDSDELGLVNARSDVVAAPAAPASDDERIAIANRTEDPARALDLLRTGTPATELDKALKAKK